MGTFSIRSSAAPSRLSCSSRRRPATRAPKARSRCSLDFTRRRRTFSRCPASRRRPAASRRSRSTITPISSMRSSGRRWRGFPLGGAISTPEASSQRPRRRPRRAAAPAWSRPCADLPRSCALSRGRRCSRETTSSGTRGCLTRRAIPTRCAATSGHGRSSTAPTRSPRSASPSPPSSARAARRGSIRPGPRPPSGTTRRRRATCRRR
mmetsp:Transcript_23285/g.68404  ORF Transcript_23285/g.68404 Transcript_23285/m.68404 type:complete len:208 (+) Transcript_23285:167-790(+)